VVVIITRQGSEQTDFRLIGEKDPVLRSRPFLDPERRNGFIALDAPLQDEHSTGDHPVGGRNPLRHGLPRGNGGKRHPNGPQQE